MEVINNNQVNPSLFKDGVACVLGFFDGVHVGHQNLISVLKDNAGNNNIKSMVFTFESHPMTILDNNNAPCLITDNITKAQILRGLGIDILNFAHISPEFLNIEPEAFLQDILIKQFNVRKIVAGFNFRFGYKGRGDSDFLINYGARMGIDVSIVQPIYVEDVIVSSTVIREYLKKGNIKMANKLLGRCYSMHGNIVHGKGRGHNLGFPTANIIINRELILPRNGVYATRVSIGDIQKIGITNIGFNPTFGSNYISVETHIIDFNEDIYGKDMKIDFYGRIRDERPFVCASQLSEQIAQDRSFAIEYFK